MSADKTKVLDKNGLSTLWNRIKTLITNNLSSFKSSLNSNDTATGSYIDVSVGQSSGNINVDIDETKLTSKLKEHDDNLTEVSADITEIKNILSVSEDSDDVINRFSEVINYFNNVNETETGAALLTDVANNKKSISDLDDKIDKVNVTMNGTCKDGVLTLTAVKTN